MEEQAQTRHQETSNHDAAGPSVSSSSHVSEQHVEPEHTEVEQQVEQQQQRPSTERRGRQPWHPHYMLRRFRIHLSSSMMETDVWSCAIVILTFWFFGSMILILGLYGSYNLELGPNCSYAIGANPFFVHTIQAEQVDDQTAGPILYGFHEAPSLEVETSWSQSHTASVEPHFHREWTYFLNAGSRVSVYYDVKAPSSYPLSLVIAQGREALVEWIDNPSYPDTTLSWNIVYGNGTITQDITKSQTYYVAVGNMNSETVEVYLSISIWSLLHNTSNAHFKCSLSNHICSFKLILMKPNVAVLTTPGPAQVDADSDWYIQISYGPQWLTYCIGSCVVTVAILVLFRYCNQCQSNTGTYNSGNRARANGTEREPLLSPKSDDHSSMGSSYDSLPCDEEDLEDGINAEGCLEGKIPKDGESNSNARRLCAICFDAPKDCFFVPCGHSAACFSCGSRIAEDAGICPICRRKLKKVRKIFSV